MKNLIKTLVCAVLVLLVVSCRSNDDKFVESVKSVQNSDRIESTPNKINYINIKKEVNTVGSNSVSKYTLYSIIKRFVAKGSKTDKIVKITYNISFKYSHSGIDQNFTHEHIENLNLKLSSVKYDDIIILNALPLQTGGKKVDRFYDGKILVIITTESGAKYSNYLENITFNIYQ